jgi:putative methionine-R-sulfoxide reductase with GAF domain
VPLVDHGATRLVLDVDSDKLNDFDATHQLYLERIAGLILRRHFCARTVFTRV